jgi:hypothetical protein
MRDATSRSGARFALGIALLSLLPLLATGPAAGAAGPAEQRIAAADAAQHVNEQARVCGFVAGAYHASRSRGEPTFLDFERAHPGEVFKVVIWNTDRDKFKPPPESSYDHKNVCVTGRIQLHKGVPEIIVRDPSQLSLDDRARRPA